MVCELFSFMGGRDLKGLRKKDSCNPTFFWPKYFLDPNI